MAATWGDLFYSILSLDAYNRGYGRGMDVGSNAPGTKIGDASILMERAIPSTSFYQLLRSRLRMGGRDCHLVSGHQIPGPSGFGRHSQWLVHQPGIWAGISGQGRSGFLYGG